MYTCQVESEDSSDEFSLVFKCDEIEFIPCFRAVFNRVIKVIGLYPVIDSRHFSTESEKQNQTQSRLVRKR